MEEKKAPRRKMTTAEYKELLQKRVQAELEKGLAPDKAIETALTPSQYDWLIDHDIDFDELLVGREKLDAAKKAERKERGRRLSPEGYKKKYPEDKQELYNGIVEYLKSVGAEIIPPEKMNYRNLDFMYKGAKRRIILSNPTK